MFSWGYPLSPRKSLEKVRATAHTHTHTHMWHLRLWICSAVVFLATFAVTMLTSPQLLSNTRKRGNETSSILGRVDWNEVKQVLPNVTIHVDSYAVPAELLSPNSSNYTVPRVNASWYRCPSPAISGDVELCKSFAHMQKHPAEHARCLSVVVDSLCGSTAVPLLELSGYTIVGYSSLEHAIQRVAPPKNTRDRRVDSVVLVRVLAKPRVRRV